MATRSDPYGAFNFLVTLGNTGGNDVAAGFAEVSGLGTEIHYVEYRNGNEKELHTRKLPGLTSHPDLVLRRGIIGDLSLFEWIKGVSEGVADKRTVVVTLLDEQRASVAEWVLHNAQPKRWTGPTLQAKGGGEVAMEELVITYERLDFVSS